MRSDHVGLVICGTRRARQWQRALAAEGIAATIEDTTGDEADGGACKVCVPRSRRVDAAAVVTAVTRGERRLPGLELPRWQAVAALTALAALLGAAALRLLAGP